MQEIRVRSLGWEVPLEKGLSVLSSICAWRIPWTQKPGRLQSVGSQRVRHNWATNTHNTHTHTSHTHTHTHTHYTLNRNLYFSFKAELLRQQAFIECLIQADIGRVRGQKWTMPDPTLFPSPAREGRGKRLALSMWQVYLARYPTWLSQLLEKQCKWDLPLPYKKRETFQLLMEKPLLPCKF